MNVANLDLCKELYALSGFTWKSEQYHPSLVTPFKDSAIPAYPLSYLLRKLPEKIMLSDRDFGTLPAWLSMDNLGSDGWQFGYRMGKSIKVFCVADTPEDAVCKLAIELFRQGILTREDK